MSSPGLKSFAAAGRVGLVLLWVISRPAIAQPRDAALVYVPPPVPEGLETIEFYSPAVDRGMKFDIVLPENYAESDERYPVLYLLHGYMQNYTIWGRNLGAAFYARNLGGLILVVPDGGNTWFVNYALSENNQKNDWEDYLIQDLVGYVDGHYRTLATREGRAIAGLSMGGYAAITLGLRHPAMFVSLGSTSGALGYARDQAELLRQGLTPQPQQRPAEIQAQIDQADEYISREIAIPGFSTQKERTPAGAAFITAEQAEAYDPYTIIYDVPKNQLPHFYIDSGTEDGAVADAREFMGILLINNVAFDFMQSRGRHNAEYWRRSIGHMMTIQYEIMQRALGNRP
ncbi:MAG: alpha/beta hydrolase-fold protein [Pseudohongiellaceae bacterium]